jgi:hypothetical protein
MTNLGHSPSRSHKSESAHQNTCTNMQQHENGPKMERGLDSLTPPIQFVVLACGVFFFFGIHNILQEAMMKIPGFNFGVMLGYMEVVGTYIFVPDSTGVLNLKLGKNLIGGRDMRSWNQSH